MGLMKLEAFDTLLQSISNFDPVPIIYNSEFQDSGLDDGHLEWATKSGTIPEFDKVHAYGVYMSTVCEDFKDELKLNFDNSSINTANSNDTLEILLTKLDLTYTELLKTSPSFQTHNNPILLLHDQQTGIKHYYELTEDEFAKCWDTHTKQIEELASYLKQQILFSPNSQEDEHIQSMEPTSDSNHQMLKTNLSADELGVLFRALKEADIITSTPTEIFNFVHSSIQTKTDTIPSFDLIRTRYYKARDVKSFSIVSIGLDKASKIIEENLKPDFLK